MVVCDWRGHRKDDIEYRLWVSDKKTLYQNPIRWDENDGQIPRFTMDPESRIPKAYEEHQIKSERSHFEAAKDLQPLWTKSVKEYTTTVIVPIEWTFPQGTKVQIKKIMVKNKAVKEKLALIVIDKGEFLVLQSDLSTMSLEE